MLAAATLSLLFVSNRFAPAETFHVDGVERSVRFAGTHGDLVSETLTVSQGAKTITIHVSAYHSRHARRAMLVQEGDEIEVRARISGTEIRARLDEIKRIRR